jgi:ParB-like nuclease family protein
MASNCTNDDRYRVEYLPIEAIKPSPENDKIYGKIDEDDEMSLALADSIRERGLEEPLILTADGYILSGHRRFAVCKDVMDEIPCRIKPDIRRIGNPDYMRDLIAYNPQRVKSVGTILRGAILRDSTTLADTQAAISRVNATHEPTVKPDYIKVPGHKAIGSIGFGQRDLLKAVQRIVHHLGSYWPLSIRQIHYRLLNDPPLWRVVERSQFGKDPLSLSKRQAILQSAMPCVYASKIFGRSPVGFNR